MKKVMSLIAFVAVLSTYASAFASDSDCAFKYNKGLTASTAVVQTKGQLETRGTQGTTGLNH